MVLTKCERTCTKYERRFPCLGIDHPFSSHNLSSLHKLSTVVIDYTSKMSLGTTYQESSRVSRDRFVRSRFPRRSHEVALFVKVLFLYLKHSGEPQLLADVKCVVRECLRQNRCGDPAYVPLSGMTLDRLYRAVGPRHWSRASFYYRSCRRARRDFGTTRSPFA